MFLGYHPEKIWVYSFFFLLSLIQYTKFKKSGSHLNFGISILFFLLSLLSKANAVVLPALFLVIDWFLDDKNWKKSMLRQLPLFLISGAFVILTINAQKSAGFIADSNTTHSVLDRFFFLTYSLIHYIINLIAPLSLSPKNFYPEKTENLLPLMYYGSVLIIGAITFLSFNSKYKKHLLFGFLFLAFTLGPVLKIIPTGNDIVSNRYAYMPYIGLYASLTYIVFKLNKTWIKIICSILLIAFTYKTYTYQYTYENSVSVWSAVIESSKGNNWANAMAFNERGQVHLKTRNKNAALKDINKALKLEPTILRGLMNRANIYEIDNRLDLALKDLNKALELEPDHVEALRIRSVIHGKMNQPELSIIDLDKAITLSPKRADLYNNRGIANSIIGNTDAAVNDFSEAIALNQYYLDPFVNRANLFITLNQPKEAQKDLAIVYQKQPDNFIYAYLIAKTHLMQDNEKKAHEFLAQFANNEITAGSIAERLSADGYHRESIPYYNIAMGNESIREKSLYQRANAFKETSRVPKCN